LTVQNHLDSLSATEIKSKLDQHQGVPYLFPNPELYVKGPARDAAVLIPLIRSENNWELLFIRRTKVDGDPHSGQVAFPGGRRDEDDRSVQENATREAREEIGVQADEIEILGKLEHMVTISNYKLTPIVGWLKNWPISLIAQETEVARIFQIPLTWLANADNLRIENREIRGSDLKTPIYYFEEFDGEKLWGVTAHIVVNFLRALS
jgi:8-oxo-dGTP pyrophosphatase MutT (NUDIX family)